MRYLSYYEQHLLERLSNLEKTPLQKLSECKVTLDGRYIIFEGVAYSTSTGQEVPINEDWTISDILHTGADVLSMGMDFIVPGSGAIVDILNGLSYVLEAQTKSDQKQKDSLYLMGAISLAFVLLPGPLQAISIPLKNALKTGKGMNNPVVKNGLKIIGENIKVIFDGMYKKINEALKSPLAKGILGKWKGKISGALSNFRARLTPILEPLVLFKGSADKAGNVVVSASGKNAAEAVVKTGQKISAKASLKGMAGYSAEEFVKISKYFDGAQPVKSALSAPPVGLKNYAYKLPDELGDLATLKPSSQLAMGYVEDKVLPGWAKQFNNLPKTFDPSKVKITGSPVSFYGREVIEVELEGGIKTLFYKSTGQNVATTGKKAGEWFVIPGFCAHEFEESGVKEVRSWFMKTTSTVAMTKGGNEYLTQMAKLLEKEGPDAFAKSAAKESGPLLLGMGSREVSQELLPQVTQRAVSLSRMSNVKLGNYSSELMSKLSLKPGTKLATTKGTNVTIGNIIDVDYVEIIEDVAGKTVKKKYPIWKWLCKNILQPSAKLNTTGIPLITKFILRAMNADGTVNTEGLKKLDEITPEQLTKDMEILAPYQGTPEQGEFIYDVEGDSKYLYSYNNGRWYALNKESGKIFDISKSEKFKESVEKLNKNYPEVVKDSTPAKPGTSQYDINDKVTLSQKALLLLGYDIGKGGPQNDGADGKLGPKTRSALNKFQNDNGMQGLEGKLTRSTARKLADMLSSKGIQNSTELVDKLKNI